MQGITQKIKLYLNAFLPPILWAGLIFILSNQSNLPGPNVYLFDFLFKKMAHIFVYFVLYFLFYRAIAKTSNSQRLRLILPILICIIYAMSDEIHQSLIPNRYPTLRDVFYDSFGVMLAFLKKHNYL